MFAKIFSRSSGQVQRGFKGDSQARNILFSWYYLNQHTKIPTIRLMQPGKTPACSSMQSDQSLGSSHMHSTASWLSGEPLPYILGDVQADLSLCWSHSSYCRFCRALAHL